MERERERERERSRETERERERERERDFQTNADACFGLQFGVSEEDRIPNKV